jgi:trimeric autotransporter adhesin
MLQVMKNQTKWAFATLFFFLIFGLSAQSPTLLKDINAAVGNSSPRNMTMVGNTVFFSAEDPIHGHELWKSDGTVAGTVLVKDIYTGSIPSNPSGLCNVNGTLFFAAGDGFLGIELWKSDGTEAGTVRVKDINPGAVSSAPINFFAAGSTVFFSADNGINGFELWKSDGTEAGTVLVKDINPGTADSGAGGFVVNGDLFFTAITAAHGRELWRTDGTALNTIMVKDINPGTPGAEPTDLIVFNGQVFFAANVTTNGVIDRELWRSNGSNAGTILLKNINPNFGSSPTDLCVFNGALFFTAHTPTHGVELHKSDGTAAGTPLTPVVDIVIGANSSLPFELTIVNNELFFSANVAQFGRELWKFTTANVASLVKDINPGTASSTPQALISVGTTLFFTADDGATGRELWKSNGSTVGTKQMQDLVVGPLGSDISQIDMAVRGTTDLFFSSNGANGRELRRATLVSVSTVRDIGQGHSNPANFVRMGNATFFTANNGTNGRELWKTDHATGITAMLKDIEVGSVGSNPVQLTVVTNGNTSTLFFVAGSFRQIFKSDGSAAGTVPVQTIFVGGMGQNPTNLTAFQGKLFFTATNSFANGVVEKRMFKTDGTINAVDQLGNTALDPQNLTAVGNNLFFTATNNDTDRELWKTTFNGMPQRVKNINTIGSSNPSQLLGIGNTLFFTATNNANTVQVFKSDGVVNGIGTAQINGASDATDLTNFDGRLVVVVRDLQFPGFHDLLRLNTAQTAFAVLSEGPISTIKAAGTRLFMLGGHGLFGLTVINTQGQIVHTTPLPEPNDSGLEVVAAGSKVFFAFSTAEHGRELWRSDATTTGLVSNIWPGAGSANVNGLALCGSDLFFSANNLTNGQEPWFIAGAANFDDGGADDRSNTDAVEAEPTAPTLDISVFPNPATEVVRVQFSDTENASGDVVLLDATGRVLRSEQVLSGEMTLEFEVRHLPKGTYFVRWMPAGAAAVTKKVLVQ